MDRLTDRPDMTSAVYRGRKASAQTNKHIIFQSLPDVSRFFVKRLHFKLLETQENIAKFRHVMKAEYL